MSKILKCVSFAAVGAVATTGLANAQQGEFSGNVALTSDYVWRGVSQNNEEVAVQGGFDYTNSGFYAGTWASTAASGGANTEVDIYAGYSGDNGNGFTYDVGVIGYLYPGADDLDFAEVYGGVGYDINAVSLGASVAFDPDNENTYVEGTVGYQVADNFSVDAGVGNASFDGGDDYNQFNVGATYSVPEYFDIDIRYWSNDADTDVDIFDDRVAVTISRSF